MITSNISKAVKSIVSPPLQENNFINYNLIKKRNTKSYNSESCNN